ncbi:MAG: hypothetical protein COA47_08155 [Robiginitomaculum sp.]|nr:MAG: hypothetical protein COA47_08155 [Robiginitomaculum sp.]
MTNSLIFAPLVPVIWLALISALGLGFSIWAGWHRPIWLALRLVLIGALVFLAMGPQKIKTEHEYLSDIALLLVDDTHSMQLGGRAEIAKQAAEQIREAAKEDPMLDVLEIKVSDAPEGTRLFDALQSGLGQIPAERLAGAVVVTDGIIHDRLAEFDLDAPIHALLSGDPQLGDRTLKIIEAPRFGIVGERVQFTIRVDEFGQSTPTAALVTLQVAGEPAQSARVQTGKNVTVGLPLQSRGTNLVEIRVEPAGEELTLINNRVAIDVTGVRERLRVLLVSGEPYAGVRAWRNLLKSDPAVDLVHFTILRPPTKRDATPLNEMALIAFPTRELFVNKLDSFDLVIFDRYTRRGVLPLLYLENVVRYVEKGGALMVAAGPPFAGEASLSKTFLAGILPARPDGKINTVPYSPRLTETGIKHPVTSVLHEQQENWGRWGRSIGVTGVTGDVVLSAADDQPLLVLDRVGAGRVALLLSDQAWLWSRGFEGGGPQYEMYRRLAHWLMKEPELEEEALSGFIRDDKLHVTLQTLSDAPPSVEVETPDGQITHLALQAVSPGIFTAEMPVAPNGGLLTLKSGDLLAVAAQGQLNLPELTNLQLQAEPLASLVKQQAGAVFHLTKLSTNFDVRRTRPDDRQKGRNWLGLQKNRFSLQTQSTRQPLFAPWMALIIILLLIAGMWIREGRSG